jgi:hypothetical protein
MKRTIISAAVLALGLAGAGVSLADPGNGGPGPNGHNNWGLCNAYAHNGGNNHGQPFQALEDEAEAANQTVAEWCAANGQKPGGGKG